MNTDGITIQDKNNNKITLSSSGIELNTPSDIKLIPPRATYNSRHTGNAQISATGDVTASGMGVSLSANSWFKASGMASTGNIVHRHHDGKGTMVMIN